MLLELALFMLEVSLVLFTVYDIVHLQVTKRRVHELIEQTHLQSIENGVR